MTQNIRNIMRNQDKGLLTTSTRLLNASVRNKDFKDEISKRSLSRDASPQPAAKGKAISTIELLQRSKKPRQSTQSLSDMNSHAGFLSGAASVPVMPTLGTLRQG